jgi:hypothetical protein
MFINIQLEFERGTSKARIISFKCRAMKTYSAKKPRGTGIRFMVEGGTSLPDTDFLYANSIHFINNNYYGFNPISDFLGTRHTPTKSRAAIRDINNRIKYFIGHDSPTLIHPINYTLVAINKYKDDSWKERREIIFITLNCKKLAELVGYQYSPASMGIDKEFTRRDIIDCITTDHNSILIPEYDPEDKAKGILNKEVSSFYYRERLATYASDTFEKFIEAFSVTFSKGNIDNFFKARIRDHLIELTHIRDSFAVDSVAAQG